MRVFFLRKCGERLAPLLERTDCQLPWCTGVEMPMGRGHRCPDMSPKGPKATGEVTPAVYCPVYAHASAPASLPQSPPAATPGPHLEVISCLTSSRLMASLG